MNSRSRLGLSCVPKEHSSLHCTQIGTQLWANWQNTAFKIYSSPPCKDSLLLKHTYLDIKRGIRNILTKHQLFVTHIRS